MPNPFGKKKEEREELEKVGGTFDCQTCYEKVRGGYVEPSSGDLNWVCSKGHTSKVEGLFR